MQYYFNFGILCCSGQTVDWLVTLINTHRSIWSGGFLLNRVMFEVFAICLQATKRWVTLLAVQQEGYALKNLRWFEVSALVLISLVSLHLLNVVRGRNAKNAVFNLSNCKFKISV